MQQRIRTLPWLAALTALLAAFAASALVAAKAHALDPVTGRRRALVIVVQWGDVYENIPASTPRHTGEELAAAMDDNVSPWYASVARGPFQGWDVDVAGTYTIDPRDTSYPNARCAELDPRVAIAVRARAAASNDGFDMDDYDDILIYNEAPAGCGWSANFDIYQHVWLRSLDTDAMKHMLAHRLGLEHSGTLECRDGAGRQVTLSNDCTTTDRGDAYSLMGGGQGSFAASQQWAIGWMGQRKLDLTIGSQPAHLFLQPLESTGLTIQALRIDEPDATYWVEYRASLGVDTTPPGSSELTGVVIRRQGLNNPARSILLDMTPNGGFNFGDADLPAGQTWSNPHGNLKFTVNSIGPLGAELTIERKVALVTVPNVLGLTRAAATRAITGAGLVLGTVSSKVDQTCDYIDTVMDQTPGGGFQRAPGSPVAITIGTRPAGGCG